MPTAYDFLAVIVIVRAVLPSKFTTALDISVEDHVKMLSVIAKYVDMSVSKTINVPTEYSFEDTKNIYMDCWKNGIKGCTIFRPNAVRQGILVETKTTDKPKSEPITPDPIESPTPTSTLHRGEWKQKAKDTVYYQRKLKTGCGKLNLFIGWSDSEQAIQDFYIKKSSQSGCERLTEAVAISMSAIIRLGGNLDNIEKALRGIGTCPSFARARAKGQQLSNGSSCGVVIFNELKQFFIEKTNKNEKEIVADKLPVKVKLSEKSIKNYNKNDTEIEENGFVCPECKKKTLRFEGGCNVCSSCGFSSCG